MTLPRLCVAAAALLVALAVGAPASRASVAEALELADLVANADQVGVALAISATARRARNQIVTDTIVEFEDRLKGEGARRIVITTLGGAIDGIGMRVEGAGHLPIGERSVVFGEQNAAGRFRPVGMAQGILPMRMDEGIAMVHPGARGMALVRRMGAGQLGPAPAALLHARPWDELREEIRELVARGGR